MSTFHLIDLSASQFLIFVPDFSSLTFDSGFVSSLLSSFFSSAGATLVSFFSSSFSSPSSLPSVFWPGDAFCDVSFVEEESYGKQHNMLWLTEASRFWFCVVKSSKVNQTVENCASIHDRWPRNLFSLFNEQLILFVVLNNHTVVLVCCSHFGINFQSMIQWVFLGFSTLQAAAFHWFSHEIKKGHYNSIIATNYFNISVLLQ